MTIVSTKQIQTGSVIYSGGSDGIHGHLLLPNGKTVAETPSDELYRLFDRLNVPGFSHSLGRVFAIEKYATEVDRIGKDAAQKAVNEWLRAAE